LQFAEGRLLEAAPHGSGHINDTFAVRLAAPGGDRRLILQRINTAVFPDPGALMENILRVTEHLRRKMGGRPDLQRRVLRVVRTREGAPFHRDGEGRVWRAYEFIEGARTFDTLGAPDQIAEAARAFGAFLAQLADLPGPPLAEVIPRFHDGARRYRLFQEAVSADACNRAAGCAPEIAYAESQAPRFELVSRLLEAGALPVRVTHNDTKINNVLLDEGTGEALCVIDLDTAMPGVSLYDFGDIVRTTASRAAEDEADLSRIRVEMERFEAIARGYLRGAGECLGADEKAHLAFGGTLMALIIGLRFLTDHLAGDRYFKIHQEGHNLRRARAQFALARSLQQHEQAMAGLIERLETQPREAP